MTYLLILNDPPYGTERNYNGLHLANALAKNEKNTVSVFLMGDAASCAAAGQTTPNGYYNVERMLKAVSSKGGKIVSAALAWMLAASRQRRLLRARIEVHWTN